MLQKVNLSLLMLHKYIFSFYGWHGIKKTDLATLTKAEWEQFCMVMCINYHQAVALNLQAKSQ